MELFEVFEVFDDGTLPSGGGILKFGILDILDILDKRTRLSGGGGGGGGGMGIVGLGATGDILFRRGGDGDGGKAMRFMRGREVYAFGASRSVWVFAEL